MNKFLKNKFSNYFPQVWTKSTYLLNYILVQLNPTTKFIDPIYSIMRFVLFISPWTSGVLN